MALVKYCNRAGCRELVPLGVKYCKAHTLVKAAEDKERHKAYDMYHRNQEAKAFYNSTEWQYVREAVLARDNHIDIYLYITEGRAVPASTVHHITELSEDYAKRCDMDNLVSVSEATHSMIGKAYNDSRRKKNMQDILRECLREYKKRLALVGV
ncbi:MAG: HNH endonuclease [Lachnospiraceae bacterium]|nr:HNH endonuclease [Lachnospiraceae bacterium]